MYMTGSDNQTEAEFHSMAAGMPSLGPNGEPVEPVEPVLVLFDERAGEGGGDVVKRELEIGCIKSATVKKVSKELRMYVYMYEILVTSLRAW